MRVRVRVRARARVRVRVRVNLLLRRPIHAAHDEAEEPRVDNLDDGVAGEQRLLRVEIDLRGFASDGDRALLEQLLHVATAWLGLGLGLGLGLE